MAKLIGFAGPAEDYQKAYSSYLKDHKAWQNEAAQYDMALVQYDDGQRRLVAWQQANSAYQAALQDYQTRMAAWNATSGGCAQNQATYQAALDVYLRARDYLNAQYATQAQQVMSRYPGQTLPPGFTCVPQSTNIAYRAACDAQLTAVQGIGGIVADPCVLYQLPVCQGLPPHPGSRPACNVGPQPVAPSAPGPAPAVPTQLPPMLRAEPQPPGVPSGVTPMSPETTDQPLVDEGGDKPTNKAGMAVGGILLLLLLGGGYAVYKSVKKKR